MSLASDLRTLESTGLIRPAAAEAELEYLFRHALAHEAVYGSLVRVDRRVLHLAAGEALAELYPQLLGSLELAPLLGRHFAEGGDQTRAHQFFLAAGEAAARVYAVPEAIAHYTAALAAARRLERTNAAGISPLTSDQWIGLYSGLGTALELSGDYSPALERYAELEALAEARTDRRMRLAALLNRAKIYATANPRYDPPLARTLLIQALDLARAGVQAADRSAEARVLWNLMVLETFAGTNLMQAREWGEESLALARRYNLREQLAFTLHDLQYSYVFTGRVDLARAALAEAQVLWRELGNQAMLADNLSNQSVRHLLSGELDAALASAAEGLQISVEIGNTWGQVNSQFFLGHAYLERGEPGKAIEVLYAAVRAARQVGHRPGLIAGQADCAWAIASLGDPERAESLVRQAVASAALFELWRSWPMATLARVLVLQGRLAEAEEALAEARSALRPGSVQLLGPIVTEFATAELALASGRFEAALEADDDALRQMADVDNRLFIPEALNLRGTALHALGRSVEAQTVFEQAVAQAEALGSRRSLWPALAALSRLAAERGEAAEAQVLRARAGEIVDYIGERAGSPELRASFLAQEPIRWLLSEVADHAH